MPRPLRVKFILPALTEAKSPFWRPIKYSLFPPLGLATLAAYLSPDDEAQIVDDHVQTLTTDDAPDLVVIQVYITNAWRAYALADHYRGTLYTGVTTDVARRVEEHNTSPKGAKYTRVRRPVSLAYQEAFATRSEACAREATIKKLSRAEKQALIA